MQSPLHAQLRVDHQKDHAAAVVGGVVCARGGAEDANSCHRERQHSSSGMFTGVRLAVFVFPFAP